MLVSVNRYRDSVAIIDLGICDWFITCGNVYWSRSFSFDYICEVFGLAHFEIGKVVL